MSLLLRLVTAIEMNLWPNLSIYFSANSTESDMVASNTEHLYQQQIQRNRKIIQQSATDIHLMTGKKTYNTAAKQNLAHNTHSLCKLPLFAWKESMYEVSKQIALPPIMFDRL